jgi:dienelactone hydrolase
MKGKAVACLFIILFTNQNTMKIRLVLLTAGICFSGMLVQAQQKKNLTPADYGKWQSLGSNDLSPNGNWIAYTVGALENNDTLFVVEKNGSKKYSLPFANSFEFSNDNQWVAYRIGLPYKEAEKLREQGRPIDYKLGLLHLASGKKEEIQQISRFGFSRNGQFLAIQLAPPKEHKDKGSMLLIRNLSDGSTHTIGNVTEYAFNKKSDYLAYVIESANTAGNAVELLNLQNYSLKIVASDTLKFSRLNWQKEGEGFVFLKQFKHKDYEEESATVHAYTGIYTTPGLKTFDPSKAAGFPANMYVHNGNSPRLSDDMRAVFFGIKEWTAKPKKEEKKAGDSTKTAAAAKPAADEKLPGLDVWHWKDTEIQPRQKVTFNQDRAASYLSVWNTDNNSFFQLAKKETPIASLTGNQAFAITSTNTKYKPAFKEDYADFYLVNTRTGESKLLYEKMLAGFSNSPMTSPDGNYLFFFRDKNWWTYTITSGKTQNITQSIKSNFWNTRDDHTASKPPFGYGGWLKGDSEVLLYDEYNVWAITPDGSNSRKLTNGEKDEIVHRFTRTDFEENYIDGSKPIYLSLYGDKTKKYGYAKLENGQVKPLIFEDLSVGRLTKAKDVNTFSYVKQDFNLSPELYTNDDFSAEKKITGTNPQQSDYFWGKSELINFTNKKGKKLQGALFYPANYEPGKKYPMIVYIYEILSNTVHGYTNPSERSAYNTTNFTSNGYFVFRPDIVYETNEPGMSAVNCVVPAVEAVLKTGMIDQSKVGLMGHSWGAYQTSYLITQTDLFKAACAGAPLTDMISMSLSIYWNSGTPDQKIFETSQGRFDGPWYERTQEHIRNSPMFNASKIKAPLLVAFGDKDGAVDWHQGIEMYGTMRRMEKPHVMLVYADENHSLAKRENQIDYQRKQREWFDHYLLGNPAENWITEGISYQEKMKAREKKPAN